MKDQLIEKLRRLVRNSQYSQVEWSTMFGVNKYTFNRWITGKQSPSSVYRNIIEKKFIDIRQ